MPRKSTIQAARRKKRQGRSPSTQAGEFVREEIHHVREGKHGARSPAQAIAIGLSKARRAGVKVPRPRRGSAAKTARGNPRSSHHRRRSLSPAARAKRARVTLSVLKHEGHQAASHSALASQARSAARRRPAAERSAAAQKAVRTKGAHERSEAARKAARTRARED